MLLGMLLEQEFISPEFLINYLNQSRALWKVHLRKKMPSFLPSFLTYFSSPARRATL